MATKNIKYSNPDTIYNDLQKMVALIIDGIKPSIIVSGKSGTGKSYSINQQIITSQLIEGVDYVSHSGKVTTYELFVALWKNRSRLIVLDDIDSALENKDSANILKAALDETKRTVSWLSKTSTFDSTGMSDEAIDRMILKTNKYPEKFEFKGRVIFITNYYYADLPEAIQSRSLVVDVTLKDIDLLKRIKSILPNIKGDNKEEVYNFFEELVTGNNLQKSLSIRNFTNALAIRSKYPKEWMRLVQLYS